ncbi:DUF3619 family protein [Wenxinia saemankumensis]|uniref:DUF3618 domain-containing protein n=1 Tax=Wenxinia saemankumensis TaxID=1447782 RepID=A0A1M6BV18_9RHOB|nr:DUF3619 family protein [Wenxinia saemankumensis]SHI52453.1 Protein of unknown function [Wenxinia saemankumensis]
MTNHYRTPEEIERDIERERSGLSSTLHDLNDRLSFDNLAGDIGHQVSGYASDLGTSVSRVVRENPVGVALTGIGIAWLIFGDQAKAKVHDLRHSDDADEYPAAAPVPAPSSRTGYSSSYTGGYTTRETYTARDPYTGRTITRTRIAARPSETGAYVSGRSSAGAWADDRNWADTDFEATHEDTDASPTFRERIWSAVEGAKDKAGELADSVRHGVHDAAHGVSDRSDRARAGLRHRTRMTSDAAKRMRSRLSEGTEHLSEDARNRVIAARERAVVARRDASDAFKRRSREVQESYDRQPLVGGAIAFAIGAAVGAMLPRTRMEDDYLGARSDELYHRAEAIFREEMKKAEGVVSDTLDAASDKLHETRGDAEDAARDLGREAKSNAQDVAATAQKSAEERKLGDVKDDRKG